MEMCLHPRPSLGYRLHQRGTFLWRTRWRRTPESDSLWPRRHYVHATTLQVRVATEIQVPYTGAIANFLASALEAHLS